MAERVDSTHERVAPLLVFKTSAFNRSATSPRLNAFNTIIFDK